MANTQMGLLGRKLGMTQIFNADGEVVPVTVVEAGPNVVLQVKTTGGNDRYDALQLGIGEARAARLTKALKGVYEKRGLTAPKLVRELRVTAEEIQKHAAGNVLRAADVFSGGQRVDVIGVSKGRGTAGVMKRHHFKGFENSHGAHEYFRHGGSIGTRLTPGHVIKGKRMGGHLGNVRVTVQNLLVVKVDAERNLLFLRGGVPGPNGGWITVRHTVKKDV